MKNLLTIGIVLFVGSILLAQNDEWDLFVNCEMVKDITHDANKIWCCTTGGIVTVDKNDYSLEYFNVTNTPMRYFSSVGEVERSSNGNLLFNHGDLYEYDGNNWTQYNDFTGQGVGVTCLTSGLNDSQLIGLSDGRILRKSPAGNFNLLQNMCLTNLVDSSVVDVYEESDSSLWACSYNGLCHFTGGQVTSYTSENSGLTETVVNCIEMDSAGVLWLGCYGLSVNGLNTFDGVNWASVDLTSIGLLSNVVRCMKIDGQGNIWVGTDGGLAVLKAGQWTAYTTFNSDLKGNVVLSIDVDEDGTAYIGTKFDLRNYTGLNILKDGQWTAISLSNSTLGSNYIEAITGKEGEVYVVAGANLSKKNLTGWERYQFPEFSGFSTFGHGVAMDSHGNPWVALNVGIVKLKDEQYSFFSHLPNNVPYDYLPTTLSIDGSDRIWLGTEEEGVYRFDGIDDWENFSTSNSPLLKNVIMDIQADGDTVWVGCGESGGFFKIVDDNWTHYSKANTPLPDKSSNWVEIIKIDGNHRKYLSPYGLCIFDDPLGDWTIYNPDNSDLPHVTVLSLAFEGDDIIWVGTVKGLVRIQGDVWKVYDGSNSPIASELVTALYVDSKNQKWIGTASGVSLFKDQLTPLIDVHATGYSKVIPNPSNGQFELDLEGLEGKIMGLEIFDGVGQLVHQEVGQVAGHKILVDMQQLPMGHYFCKVQTSGGSRVYKVFVAR